MILLLRLVFVSLLFIVTGYEAARADWDPRLQNSFQSYSNDFPGPYISTVWGGIRFSTLSSPVSSLAFNKVKIRSSFFNSGGLPVLTYISKDSKHSPRQAPLVIFMSGIFSGQTSQRSFSFAKLFAERGYHVLVLPNPLSRDYIKASPSSNPFDFEREAESALDVAKLFSNELQSKKLLTEVNLAGESYGAFLSAIMLAKDSTSAKPLISGTTTLLSVPLDMRFARQALDSLMDSEYERHLKLNLYREGRYAWSYLTAQKNSDLLPDAAAAAGTIFAYFSVNSELFNLAAELYKQRPSNKPVEFNKYQKGEKAKALFRLHDFLSMFDTEIEAKYNNEFSSLEYWLSQLGQTKLTSVRILRAADDLLNVGITTLHPRVDRVSYVLPSGGHSGFVALPWFKSFFDAAYGPVVH